MRQSELYSLFLLDAADGEGCIMNLRHGRGTAAVRKRLNCVVVFNRRKDKILFCKRAKEPYKGLYNFVGGKAEPNEEPFCAAYRELQEETGIGRDQICLFRLMDFTYYERDFVLEIYVGQLQEDMQLLEEINPLEWLPLSENFADADRFAGDGNIAHIVSMALQYPLEERTARRREGIGRGVCSAGIDGCRGGWVAAVICRGELSLYKLGSFCEAVEELSFDTCLVDMVIGLQGNDRQLRPDDTARRILRGRASTVFSAPCRRAVYGATREERLWANREVLQKGIARQTDAIIPKMREVDEFLQAHKQYKNRIQESHPEVCFARLKGEVLRSSKHDREGIRERAAVISDYLPEVTKDWVAERAVGMGCNEDDIVDAVCLAIAANMLAQGKTDTIPPEPMTDDTGLLMQMVIPKGARK